MPVCRGILWSVRITSIGCREKTIWAASAQSAVWISNCAANKADSIDTMYGSSSTIRSEHLWAFTRDSLSRSYHTGKETYGAILAPFREKAKQRPLLGYPPSADCHRQKTRRGGRKAESG